MNSICANFWRQLRTGLDEFGIKILASNPTLKYEVSNIENAAFLLRGYLAFRVRDDDAEVAVAVDVKVVDGLLTIMSDVWWDDGRLIVAGPSLIGVSYKNQQHLESVFSNWMEIFKEFLNDSESQIYGAISQL
jgi:hypothetical protein